MQSSITINYYYIHISVVFPKKALKWSMDTRKGVQLTEEIQIKITVKFHLPSFRMLILKVDNKMISAEEDV